MDDDECEAVGAIMGKENSSTRKKPAPVLVCPPQIPHYLNRARTLLSITDVAYMHRSISFIEMFIQF
jgi:hypothetical protein